MAMSASLSSDDDSGPLLGAPRACLRPRARALCSFAACTALPRVLLIYRPHAA